MDVQPLRKTDPDWFTFAWSGALVDDWQPGEFVDVGELRAPLVPTGFYARCATAGMTGAREPAWPASGSRSDGSAVWTLIAPSAASTPTIQSVTYTLTPSGISITDSTISEEVNKSRVRLDASAADEGDYELIAEMVDSDGEDHSFAITIEVIE
jgi:hypothetical protein